MGKQGGKRPGAGRPKGSRNKSTLAKIVGEALDLEVLGDAELMMLCRDRAPDVLSILVKIANNERAPAQARVNAASTVLAYGYGRPRLAPPPSQENAPDWGEPLRLVQPGDDDFDLPDLQVPEPAPQAARGAPGERPAPERANGKAQARPGKPKPWEREQEAGA